MSHHNHVALSVSTSAGERPKRGSSLVFYWSHTENILTCWSSMGQRTGADHSHFALSVSSSAGERPERGSSLVAASWSRSKRPFKACFALGAISLLAKLNLPTPACVRTAIGSSIIEWMDPTIPERTPEQVDLTISERTDQQYPSGHLSK
jgi:hypothetical protein